MGKMRMVPGGSGGGMPGSWGWAGLAFALFAGRDLAIQRHAPSLAQDAVDAEPGVPEAGVVAISRRKSRGAPRPGWTPTHQVGPRAFPAIRAMPAGAWPPSSLSFAVRVAAMQLPIRVLLALFVIGAF